MNMSCVTITNGMKFVAYAKIPASIGNWIPVCPAHGTVIIARSGNLVHCLARTCSK